MGSQILRSPASFGGLLITDTEKSIGPKLKFLQSRGVSSSELTETVSKVPKILGMKAEKSMSRYYDLVRDIIEADKSSKYVKLREGGCKQENKIRNVLVLRELGVPQRFLFPLLISKNNFFYGKERFEESLKKVVEMGFDPTTSKFVDALQIVYKLSDKTIKEKKRLGFTVGDVWEMFKKYPRFLSTSEKKITQIIEALKRCGLLEDEVLSVLNKSPRCIAFSVQNLLNTTETFIALGFSRDEFAMMVKCFPPCFNYTAETVKKKTEFLVKQMHWPLKAVALFPQVLGYNLEKRIVPRCNVIKALLSKGLIKGNELPPKSSVLACTDDTFLKRYVTKHHDKELVADLMAILNRDSAS